MAPAGDDIAVTPERWAQTKAILEQALETAPADRERFVAQACGEDAELRADVESLLAAAVEEDDSFPGARRAIVAEAGRALGLSGKNGNGDSSVHDRALLEALEAALGQQYEIVRPLGKGGMGAVYLARERALERFVAIKVLRPDLAAGAESRERFRREARIAAQLSHPGILPLHTFGEVHGLWYFVMGYVRGVSLAERLRIEGRLGYAETLRILQEVTDAVDSAHRHGVVHRDIKPANILIDSATGRTMLADFGISKVSGVGDSLTATGAIIGTPHFMSPEQSVGSSSVNERSDIYSIGAVGYMMLSGREPFADSSPQELAYRRLSTDPPPLSTVAPSVPSDLADAIMRCLARDPAARWPDARSLKEVLRGISDGASGRLPDSLRDLPAFGPYALLWVVAWTTIAFTATSVSEDRLLLLLIAGMVPLGFMLHIWNVGRNERHTIDLAKVAFWPPEWWGMWWPASLRRPTDLWKRLPWPARAVRVVLSAFIMILPAAIVLRRPLERLLGTPSEGAAAVRFAAIEAALVLATAVVTSLALWWAYRLALTRAEVVRLLFGATSPSVGWAAPRLARLLSATGDVRAPIDEAPADHVRAISDLVSSLPSDALKGCSDPLRAAQRLLASIETSDEEISALSASASATELDRLTAQLSSLKSESSPRRPERRELEELVSKQLDVVRRMRVRCEVAAQRRAERFGLLRGLWTQLCQLRDADDETPAAATQARARLTSLCREIDRALNDEAAPAG